MRPEVDALVSRDRVIAGVEKLRFFPLALAGGEGAQLIEVGGRRLLDLSATWTASGLGHSHPAIGAALARISRSAPGASVLSATHEEAVALAERLLELTPGDANRRVYLGHAGSDANDVAIRSARHATGRSVVLAFENSYHGGLGVAMAASGVHVAGGSVVASPSVEFLAYPDPYRRPETCDADLAAAVERISQGDAACLIVEPILSDGGLVVPPDGFLGALSRACTATGTLLICDEVKVGLARPGTWHAFDHDAISPDLITFGKSLGGGLPISAVVGPATVLDGPNASALLTTVGNPWSCAAARAVLQAIEDEGLVERAAKAGERLRASLLAATADLDVVGEVRGRGLVTAIDLVTSRTNRERDPALAAKVVYRAWQLGAVVYYVGGNVLEVTPPLIITDAELDRAADLLATAITDCLAGAVSDAEIAAFAGW